MFTKLAIALCLVALVSADGKRRDCCTAGDKAIVQEQWGRLWRSADSGRVKIVLGREVFERLFEVNEGYKSLFTRVNVDDLDSPEFQAHTVRVLEGLDTAISLLQDEDAARAELSHLAAQHRAREGITKTQFKELGQILINGLYNLIGDFDEDAWSSCFQRMANGITEGLPN